jgi:hypothetical protein
MKKFQTLKDIKKAIRQIERKKDKLKRKTLYSELSQDYKNFDWQ